MKYVPCSGLAGENLTKPSTVENFKKWYSGPTLLEIIGIKFDLEGVKGQLRGSALEVQLRGSA